MAINWLFALKAVPWTDLVQHAPTIVRGARKLYTTVRGGASPSADSRSAAAPTGTGADTRIAGLEARLAQIAAEQKASAELIRHLAEQNARMIEAIGIMRARARVLVGISVVAWIGVIVLAVWMAGRCRPRGRVRCPAVHRPPEESVSCIDRFCPPPPCWRRPCPPSVSSIRPSRSD